MQKFLKYFPVLIALLYFFLGAYLLIHPRFDVLSKEIRVIFAAFLFLYGGFRLARLWTKYRENREE
jgi:positive regulator of sigma E activity